MLVTMNCGFKMLRKYCYSYLLANIIPFYLIVINLECSLMPDIARPFLPCPLFFKYFEL